MSMNATQLAEFLGVSLQTVYTYIKNGIIVPENLDSWQIDSQYIISQEEADRVKELLRPDGLTTREVAELVGCEQRHVIDAINEGKLNVKVRDITKRKQYFVQDDEQLEQFKRSFKQEMKKSIKYHDPQKKLYLFQSFFHRADGTMARIMNLEEEKSIAIDQFAKNISLEDLKKKYEPARKYVHKKPIHKPGYVDFEFILPSHTKALTYDVIEYIIEEIGINNVVINIEEEKIKFSVKPSLLPIGSFIDDEVTGHLKRSLVKGSIIERKQDIYLDSDDRRVSGIVSTDVQERIQEMAKSEGISMEEMVGKLLKKTVLEEIM